MFRQEIFVKFSIYYSQNDANGKLQLKLFLAYILTIFLLIKIKKISLTLDGDYFNEHKNTLIKEEDIL